jgi:hypothetical protein
MSTSRQCPVCGAAFAASTGPGRPRVYCGDVCKWQAGHQDRDQERQRARERRRRQEAEWNGWTYAELMDWVASNPFTDPYAPAAQTDHAT